MEIKSVRNRCPTLDLIGIATEIHQPDFVKGLSYHLHDMVEIIYVLEGEGEHYVDGQCYPFKPGSLGIVHYNQRHSIVSKKIKYVNIYVDTQNHSVPSVPSAFATVLSRILPLHQNFQHKQNRVVNLEFSKENNPEQVLMLLYEEQSQKRPGYLEAMIKLSELFWIQCCRKMQEQLIDEPNVSHSHLDCKIMELKHYLDQGFHEKQDLSNLAKRFAMSKFHMSRLFKAYTGKSIFEYIHQRRIEYALILLQSTKKKIAEIAFDCGFLNTAHFNRTFLKLTSKQPSLYRSEG